MLFWIIFGVASFTTLIISWGITIFILRSVGKTKNSIRKRGICPDCGAELINFKKRPMQKEKKLGFSA